MKKYKNLNKILNYKILSTLPLMSISLITTKQISNAMFRYALRTLPKALQPSTQNNPNLKTTHLYRTSGKLTVVDNSSSDLSSNTSSTGNLLLQQKSSFTNIHKNHSNSISNTKSLIDNTSSKTPSPKLPKALQPSTQNNLNLKTTHIHRTNGRLTIVDNSSSDLTSNTSANSIESKSKHTPSSTPITQPASTSTSPTPDSDNLFFARYIELDSDDDFSPTPPKSPTLELEDSPAVSSTITYNFFDLDEDRASTPSKSPTPDSDNLFFARYVELDSDDEFSPTPPKSPTFELEDSPTVSSTVAQNLFDLDEDRASTPTKSPTFELEDSPGTSSTVAQNLLDLDEGTSSTPPKSSILLS